MPLVPAKGLNSGNYSLRMQYGVTVFLLKCKCRIRSDPSTLLCKLIIFFQALKKFDNLHSLTLQTCVSFNDSVVQALRLRTNSLKNLELSGYFPMLSSQALKNLAELVNLEKLNLGQNISVTDDCLLIVSECCKQLKSLDINGKNRVCKIILKKYYNHILFPL